MERKRQIVLVTLMLIIVLAIILMIVLILLRNKNLEEKNTPKDNHDVFVQESKSQRTTNTKMFYAVDECIKTYFAILKVENTNALLAYLNEEYITRNNITEQNILNILPKYQDYNTYITMQMYEISENGFTMYLVKGKIDGNYIYFEVGVDGNNGTFDIMPITEDIFYATNAGNVQSITKDIKEKKYNIVKYKYLNDEIIARTYFAEYLRIMLVDSEEAYNKLDEDYKNAKFNTIDKFIDYININREKIQNAYLIENSDITDFKNFSNYNKFKKDNDNLTIKNYSVEDYDDYKQYVCVNGYENYYIINVIYPGDYKVILDKYSIDIPQFIEQYNTSSNENKVAMNAEKIRNAINNGDCEYIYNKIDGTFKQKNFNNLVDLEEYIKNNLFEYNEFNYEEARKDEKVYILQFKVKDLEKKSQDERNGTIVMKLLENTDFVMSFSFE